MKNINLLQQRGVFYIKVLLALFIVVISLILLASRFFTLFNITNLSIHCAFIALISIGMTMTMLTNGIDLSVGSLIAVSAVFTAGLSSRGFILSVTIPILITVSLGLISGLLISKGNLQPFIATLVMMMIGRGIALLYTNERPIPIDLNVVHIYNFLGRGCVLGIPFPVIITLIAYVIIWYLLDYTSFGRKIYAIGGNEKAVKLMGINVTEGKLWVYLLSGFFAGLTGVLLAGRLGAGSPNFGEGSELDAIASAVIGGTRFAGGYGKIIRTLWGALIIVMISNILNLIGIISWYQWMIKGVIIVVAVLLQKPPGNISAVQTKIVSTR